MASKVNNKVSSSMYCKACGAANSTQATHCFACGEPLVNIAGGTGTTTNPLTGLLLPNIIIQQRYRILSVLSTDEVCTLYKAEDIQLGNRLVALKEIGQHSAGTPAIAEKIDASRREMLLLADLIHPHLPRIYDYFVEQQRWYFVMDFLVGETLAAYLKKSHYRPIPVEEVVDIGIQLSTVLDYLHLHQSPLDSHDLTLHNIWRTPDGKLYLLSIGTASITSAVAAMPERNTIHSLGVILRQLQTGKTPLRSRLHVALPRLRKRPKHAKHPQSTSLAVLIQSMTHGNVHKKPYNIGVVKQELQHLAAQPSTASTLKKGRFSRRTLLKWGQLVGLAGLAAASSVVTWQVKLQSRQIPITSYSPSLGGTISTYDAHNVALAVAWSPNGTRVAMGNWSGQIQAWDANTGHHVLNFHDLSDGQRVEALIWLPDGRSIVTGNDDAVISLWDAATGRIRSTYHGHTDWVITVAGSPDGKYIASGGNDQTVQVWEVATGRQIVIYRGHSSGIGSVAWSPDGRYIASASFDMTVQIWEATTGRLIYTYRGHTHEVYTVAWSPDGQRIASGGKDLTIQVWPVTLFERNDQLPNSAAIRYHGHTKAVQAVAWSPNSIFIASAGDNVHLWNGLTGAHIYTYTKHATSATQGVQAVAWSPNGNYIASGGLEGTVQVWNAT